MVNGGQWWSRGAKAPQGFPMGVQFCLMGSRGVIGGHESWLFNCGKYLFLRISGRVLPVSS